MEFLTEDNLSGITFSTLQINTQTINDVAKFKAVTKSKSYLLENEVLENELIFVLWFTYSVRQLS